MGLAAQIVLFDGFDPLDAIAPFEVLAAGSDAAGGALHVEFVSAEGPRRVVSGTRGLPLEATGILDPRQPGCLVASRVRGDGRRVSYEVAPAAVRAASADLGGHSPLDARRGANRRCAGDECLVGGRTP